MSADRPPAETTPPARPDLAASSVAANQLLAGLGPGLHGTPTPEPIGYLITTFTEHGFEVPIPDQDLSDSLAEGARFAEHMTRVTGGTHLVRAVYPVPDASAGRR